MPQKRRRTIRQAVLETVEAHPGVGQGALVEHLREEVRGMTKARAIEALRLLEREGSLVIRRNGSRKVFELPADAEPELQSAPEASAEPRPERTRIVIGGELPPVEEPLPEPTAPLPRPRRRRAPTFRPPASHGRPRIGRPRPALPSRPAAPLPGTPLAPVKQPRLDYRRLPPRVLAVAIVAVVLWDLLLIWLILNA